MHWPFLRVKVAERSMEPALRPGDWLLVRRTGRIRAGQIVLARHPGQPGLLIVRGPGSRWPGTVVVAAGSSVTSLLRAGIRSPPTACNLRPAAHDEKRAAPSPTWGGR